MSPTSSWDCILLRPISGLVFSDDQEISGLFSGQKENNVNWWGIVNFCNIANDHRI